MDFKNHEVISYYGTGDVKITKRGNLKIGRITMQRKGGDGGSPSANMLQFKLNYLDFVEVEDS